MLIHELMHYVSQNGIKGAGIFVELCAMPDKLNRTINRDLQIKSRKA